MKKRMISILLLTCFLLLCGCEKEEELKTKMIWVLQKEEQTVTTSERGTDGKGQVGSEKTDYVTTYAYDSCGNITLEARSDNNKDPKTTTHSYEYGDNGQILRETIRKNGSISSDYRFTYDERGNILVRNQASLSGRVVEIKFTYDEQNRLLTQTSKASVEEDGIRYVYDDANRTHTVTTYSKNKVKFQREIKLDDQGRVVSNIELVGNSISDYSYRYEYGDGFVKMLVLQRMGTEGLIPVTSYTGDAPYYYNLLITYYDNQGRVIREEGWNHETETNWPDTPTGATFYTYDENGNLIKKVDEVYHHFTKDPENGNVVPVFSSETFTTNYTYAQIEIPA